MYYLPIEWELKKAVYPTNQVGAKKAVYPTNLSGNEKSEGLVFQSLYF